VNCCVKSPEPRVNRLVGRSKSKYCLTLLAAICLLPSGCRIIGSEAGVRRAARIASIGSRDNIHVKPVRQNRELGFLTQVFVNAPEPSERTMQLLRRYNLAERYANDPEYVVRWMKDICTNALTMEEVHALAEIALIQGDWAARNRRTKQATEYYATALVHAYQFLFDSKLDLHRNAYDPQFRSICDVYNESLEGILRVACSSGQVQQGLAHTIGEGDMEFSFTVEVQGRWKDYQFERFELTSNYEMKGIENLYHTYGLGVPLIAVHQADEMDRPTEKYYPPSLALPLTAFCEVLPMEPEGASTGPKRRQAILKLYDPLEQTNAQVAGRTIPLESDVTTPLAYQLNDPLLNTGVLATAAMVDATIAKDLYGLYMLEPFDPNKIPVVMVHGLWSSPMTWMEMFNDLRANRELRANYQFWFYAYPTGQPIWNSARQMRYDLAEARNDLDPNGDSNSLNKIVLVGHSMGGLVSRLQTTRSEDKFWNIVSDEGFEKMTGDPDSLRVLQDTFFFEPDPSVKRVITIATPLRGSSLANNATKWASQKIFRLPETITNDFQSLAKENQHIIKDARILTVTTSIDSLSPDSPFIRSMLEARTAEDVKFHNVVGRLPRKSMLSSQVEGDGVVTVTSAHADDVESEIDVPEEHQEVHQHPLSILEVRRILLEHLVEHDRISEPRPPLFPTAAQQQKASTTSGSVVKQTAFGGE